MTNADILTLPAGPELDTLVAEKVLGWRDCNPLGCGYRPDGSYGSRPWFSMNVDAACEVMERFERGMISKAMMGCWAQVEHNCQWYEATAPSAALAICRAALAAVHSEVTNVRQ